MQGQGLEDIPWAQPPGFLVHQRFLVHIEQLEMGPLNRLDLPDETLVIDDEVVDMQGRQVVGELNIVQGLTGELTGLDLAGALPEGALDLVVTAGQQVDVVEQLVGVVIRGIDATGPGLEPHVDVFRDQRDAVVRMADLQLAQLVDDLVVVEVVGQTVGGERRLVHQDGEGAVGPQFAALDGHA